MFQQIAQSENHILSTNVKKALNLSITKKIQHSKPVVLQMVGLKCLNVLKVKIKQNIFS